MEYGETAVEISQCQIRVKVNSYLGLSFFPLKKERKERD